MNSWKMVLLWVMVAALVFSFTVCQKKVEKAKTSAAVADTEISSTTEEVKTEAEAVKEKEMTEKPPVAEEKPAMAAEKPEMAETPAAKEEKPVEKSMAEEAAKPLTPENAAAVIELGKGGRIVFEFYPKDAPKTVENFITLANKGFYNGLKFHRVVPDFVVQGGDPSGDGTGGPGYTIKAEFNSQKHLKGTVAMARSNHPDSAGSQFYICLEPQPFLDGKYTVFGQVIEGMDLVEGIQVGDVMKTVTIVDKSTLKK